MTSLKRYQIMLELWQDDYLNSIKGDTSKSETLRDIICQHILGKSPKMSSADMSFHARKKVNL